MDAEAAKAWRRVLLGPEGRLLLRGLIQLCRPFDPLPVASQDGRSDAPLATYAAGQKHVFFALLRSAGLEIDFDLRGREPKEAER